MFGMFRKKNKSPLTISGEYNGSYSSIKQKVLSAELIFSENGISFIFDKGIKQLVKTFGWDEVSGFDFKSSKNGKDIIFNTMLYLVDGEYILLNETIAHNDVQAANEYASKIYYKKVKQFVLEKLTSDSEK